MLDQFVGQEIAGFKLTRKVGEGAMAVVFRGENVLNGAITRAIKVVRPELSSRAEFTRRFAREASLLESLQHDNVVRFYGLRMERRGDAQLLLMELELLEGHSVTDALQRNQVALPLATAVEWALAAARGVAAAHELGIVHRDIKPDNLFLTSKGKIKVLDFGIAKALDDATARRSSPAWAWCRARPPTWRRRSAREKSRRRAPTCTRSVSC